MMQEGTFNGTDAVGKRLSIEIGCAVRIPLSGTVFICNHDVKFSIQRLVNSGDWSWAKEHHKGGMGNGSN